MATDIFFLHQTQQWRDSCTRNSEKGGGGTGGRSGGGQIHLITKGTGTPDRRTCQDTCNSKEVGARQEHREGSSQLKPTYTHRPIDKFHLGSLSTYTRSFNSIPPLTAVMLLLKKGAQLEIYFISLRHCQDRPTQHHLPFARSAPTPSVVE